MNWTISVLNCDEMRVLPCWLPGTDWKLKLNLSMSPHLSLSGCHGIQAVCDVLWLIKYILFVK